MTTIHQTFSRVALSSPAALMIRDGDCDISYREMDLITNRIAHKLRSFGVEKGSLVALYMDKSIRSFCAILGVLKAGGTYIPLDVDAPVKRLATILDDVECRVGLFDEFSKESFLKLSACTMQSLVGLELQNSIDFLRDFPGSTPSEVNEQDDPAYIIYTSGSTGKPKGVVVSHRAVLHYSDWTIRYFGVTPKDRLSSHASLHFDLSVFDVYTAILSGASLHLAPKTVSMFPLKFFEFINSERISIWCSVPSLLTYIARSGALELEKIDSLRVVTFCGEVMPTTTIIKWMKAFPSVRYVNQYGPTEATCACLYHEIHSIPEEPSRPLLIGMPLPGMSAFAVSEGGEVNAIEGELYLAGPQLADGYWNDPIQTGAVFLADPRGIEKKAYATGDIVRYQKGKGFSFVGRKDSQIKYMGYRIELGEIEAVLMAVDSVAAVAVLGVPSKAGDTTVIEAFVSPKDVDVDALGVLLKERLPTYMVPRKITALAKLPHNANGKIDRKKLFFEYGNK